MKVQFSKNVPQEVMIALVIVCIRINWIPVMLVVNALISEI